MEKYRYKGKEYDCAAESDFKIWVIKLGPFSSASLLEEEIEFRGWVCTIYSSSIHFDTMSTELLLRRERRIVNGESSNSD